MRTRTAEDRDLARLFEAVSGRLSEKQKAAFVLREMEDCDTKDIAEILGCGESTVRNHLFNARRILRTCSECQGQRCDCKNALHAL